MRLTTTTNVSVDGVMQGLGGPHEDRSGGFERGGWVIPLNDKESGDYINQIYGDATAFLFGRRTYEIFAGSWGTMAELIRHPDRHRAERPAQVRGIGRPHRTEVGGHNCPDRRSRRSHS